MFYSFFVSRLALPERPKEEREAHLTAGRVPTCAPTVAAAGPAAAVQSLASTTEGEMDGYRPARRRHLERQPDRGVRPIDSVGSGAFGPLDITWASRAEEPDGRTSPEELIAAAHAACVSMALSHGLAEAGSPPSS